MTMYLDLLTVKKKNPLYLISKRQICEGWQILGPSNSNKQQPSRALVHRFLTRWVQEGVVIGMWMYDDISLRLNVCDVNSFISTYFKENQHGMQKGKYEGYKIILFTL